MHVLCIYVLTFIPQLLRGWKHRGERNLTETRDSQKKSVWQQFQIKYFVFSRVQTFEF